jgi:hypothetical protein
VGNCIDQYLLRILNPKPLSLEPEEMQNNSPLDIDTVAKLVLQPIACNWDGCTATVNSLHTFQKVSFICCRFAELFISHIDNPDLACTATSAR